ncbi:hypothetical protein DFJ73DRAFT_131662 [Zopfochytrium polystomum]|nr:hypothetical protein DFJ73DRAFT_131662 [Zopfochytrium polystomum]
MTSSLSLPFPCLLCPTHPTPGGFANEALHRTLTSGCFSFSCFRSPPPTYFSVPPLFSFFATNCRVPRPPSLFAVPWCPIPSLPSLFFPLFLHFPLGLFLFVSSSRTTSPSTFQNRCSLRPSRGFTCSKEILSVPTSHPSSLSARGACVCVVLLFLC